MKIIENDDPLFSLTKEKVLFPLSMYALVKALGNDGLPLSWIDSQQEEEEKKEDVPDSVLKLMVKWGWHIGDIDIRGRTALHAACDTGSNNWALCCKRQPCQVQAITSCQLLKFNRDTLLKIANLNDFDMYRIFHRFIEGIRGNHSLETVMKMAMEDPRFKLYKDIVSFPLTLYGLVMALGNEGLPPHMIHGQGIEDEVPHSLIFLMARWGWRINDIDLKGRIALHAASLIGSEQWVNFLLRNGLDPCQRDNDGQQPIFLAVHNRINMVVQDMLMDAEEEKHEVNDAGGSDILLNILTEKVEALEKQIRELQQQNQILEEKMCISI